MQFEMKSKHTFVGVYFINVFHFFTKIGIVARADVGGMVLLNYW